jgi:biopolymer transport protein TolR
VEFRRRRKADAVIDMTPMIDTLLQLFVVFLLSMSFITSAVRLDLPQASLQQPAPETPVVVTVDAGNNLFLNNDAVARDELPQRLATALATSQRREVLLRADRTLVYDKVLETIVGIQKGGAGNILLSYDFNGGR